MNQVLMNAVVESARERSAMRDEIGAGVWQLMLNESESHWNTARLVRVLRCRFAGGDENLRRGLNRV